MIERQPFGTTPDGAAATRYVLVAGSARVAVTDYGATLLSVEVPDRDGRAGDVLLGYDLLEGYLGPNPACYGGTIGPVANRTDRAEVPLAGALYHLPGNDGPNAANNLHTDLGRGLHRRVWSAQADDAANAVRMTCRMADGELGLPGNRTFSASFSLAEKDGAAELTISYACESDATTYVNMTNHGYYNLAGHASGSVLGELVTLDADAFLPVREDSVSEGEVRDVAGTPFDFREPRALGAGADADDEQIRRARGYDHCMCVRGYEAGAAPRHALRAEDPTSGRVMDVLITAPGAHLYTGNWLDDSETKDGAAYGPRAGFAFEPEFYPDNIHHPEWERSVCEPGSPWTSTIVLRFSVTD
ncbi:MAG TPA: galactose mutarotase [Candidatus Olsenella avicola]|nr:galactose mutarotase [Candidatus Olsenella avicola]